MTRIVRAVTYDVRFPTSRSGAGSDAMNPDPDYSAAYVVLETDHPDGLDRRRDDVHDRPRHGALCRRDRALAPHVVGRTMEELIADLRGLWRTLVSDSQLRWLGPRRA